MDNSVIVHRRRRSTLTPAWRGQTRQVQVSVAIVGLAVVGALLLTGPGPVAAAPDSAVPTGAVAYASPVQPLVVRRGFDGLASRYAAGHRGVDLSAPTDGLVHAAAEGTVTFAGAVAGRGVVVVAHVDGIRTSYEPLRPMVGVGTAVRRGDVLGTIDGTHGDFAEDAVVHWGARRGEAYLDPLLLLRPLGPVRLLPW